MVHPMHVFRVSGVVCAVMFATLFYGQKSVAADFRLTVVHRFAGTTDGEFPETGLAIHESNLYGSTYGALGGGPGKTCAKNCGTLYSYGVSTKTFTTLYPFQGSSDGAFPTGQPVYHQDAIYGTTEFGGGTSCGGTGCGVLFSSPATGGSDTKLFTFCTTSYPECPNGAEPFAGPSFDSAGNIYGTTELGGSADGKLCDSDFPGCGIVYMLTQSGFTVLYNFCSEPNCADGSEPSGKILVDATGNLFGTTQYGGNSESGTVFELLSGTHAYVPIYSFCSQPNCSDGSIPLAGLAEDGAGNLYGTTVEGGDSVCNCGVLFELLNNGDGTYSQTVLHTFTGGSDGYRPEAQVIIDDAGNLFGTTLKGGAGPYCSDQVLYCGTVFEWSGQTYAIRHRFGSTTDRKGGAQPQGALRESNGYLYGVTRNGGGITCQCGTIFKIQLPTDARSPAKPSGKASLRGATIWTVKK